MCEVTITLKDSERTYKKKFLVYEKFMFDISDDFRIGKFTNYTLKHFIERLKIYDEEKFVYKIYPIELKI